LGERFASIQTAAFFYSPDEPGTETLTAETNGTVYLLEPAHIHIQKAEALAKF